LGSRAKLIVRQNFPRPSGEGLQLKYTLALHQRKTIAFYAIDEKGNFSSLL
jgi:hypothetical protein